ncbi:MAG: arginase family protein [Saprospiraceae bacterium]|nr:arginase family protein [Saprospiraceae bacterium]
MKKNTETYAGVAEKFGKYENAQVLLTSLPYDGTSTWGKGADKGYEAFMDASSNMELYDIETNSEPYKNGVFLEKPLKLKNCTPEEMVLKIYKTVTAQLKTGKLLTYFGGEHSVSIGVLRAFAKKYKKLTVLQLDAHTDVSEKTFLQKAKVYFAHQIMDNDYWMEEAIKKMTNDVYITLDLDVFDSSIMPSTGTPEPGGMHWYQMLQFLRMLFLRKNIVGFDIVELAPAKGNKAPEFLAAKLYYKMLAYYFERANKKSKK